MKHFNALVRTLSAATLMITCLETHAGIGDHGQAG